MENWTSINGSYLPNNPNRYNNKNKPFFSDFKGTMLQCYEKCMDQPECKNNDNTCKNEFRNGDCFCSFRPKSKLEQKMESQLPTYVKLQKKQEEYKLIMEQYQSTYKTYLQMVTSNAIKGMKSQTKKNIALFGKEKNAARYVRVEHEDQYLHFQEIEVFDQNNVNVAASGIDKKLHWYNDCNQCGKDICSSGAYNNLNLQEINKSYIGGATDQNNTLSRGGPGKVSEIGCKRVDTSQTAIRDTSSGAIYGISNIENPGGASIYASETAFNGYPEIAIDGNKSTNAVWPNSVHTPNTGKQYVELNLGKDVQISKVVIYNRPDCCQGRLIGAQLKFLDANRKQLGQPLTLNGNMVQTFTNPLMYQPRKGLIPELFLNNVSLNTCFENCESDGKCKYVLFRHDEKQKRNICLKYTKEAEGLIDVSDSPLEFQFTGWEKETWNNKKNVNYGYGLIKKHMSTDDWKYLGNAPSLNACKAKSVHSNDGPFGSVVFFDNDKTCYGGALGGKTNETTQQNVYSSVPPGGETGKIDENELGTLNELLQLNDMLQKVSNELVELNTKVQHRGISIQQERSNMKNASKIKETEQKLKNDRIKLDKLKKNIMEIDSQQSESSLMVTSNQWYYLISTTIVIGIVGATFAVMRKVE